MSVVAHDQAQTTVAQLCELAGMRERNCMSRALILQGCHSFIEVTVQENAYLRSIMLPQSDGRTFACLGRGRSIDIDQHSRPTWQLEAWVCIMMAT